MKKFLLSLLIFYSSLNFATHNRAGEILYKRIEPKTQVVGGLTVPLYKYQITVILYTNDGTSSSPDGPIADRCTDTVYFGDGGFEVVNRSNGPSTLCVGCAPCGCPHCGEIIIDDPGGYKVKLNTYITTHIYPSAGSFTIHTSDLARNEGIHNMSNSGLQAFYLQSLLVINNFSGANSSPEFHSLPTDQGCVGKCFYHDPVPYDEDGDSLSFELSTPLGGNGQTVLGYFQPETQQGGIFDLDEKTGKLTWCSPILAAEYNVAFIVKEWRKNTSDHWELIGFVLRDMQIIVGHCPNNNPPEVILPRDTCVEAGALIKKSIKVTDLVVSPPNDPNSNTVALYGLGGAFSALNPQATLTNTLNFTPFTSSFSWQTSCDHVRQQAYLTTFKPVDQGPGIPLVNFGTYSIRVLPTSVKNVTALPGGSAIKISWSPTNCKPVNNPLVAYRIYRKNNCAAFTYIPCEAGVDPSTGFIFVGETKANISTFTDSSGLVVGMNYSYLVIAVYADGAESYGGSQVCTQLKRDVPVLLNIDIKSTSPDTGSVFVRWTKPSITPGNLDTIKTPGPYTYILQYGSGAAVNFETIHTITSPYFLSPDMVYQHTNINTSDSVANYKVIFVAGTFTVGSSPVASSVFLKAIGADKRIHLSWKNNTPWINYKYTIYRKDLQATNYFVIGSTSLNNYTDSIQIVNNNTYCYKILSEGEYSDPSIYKPLVNFSQETCATAKDLTPPCSPMISVDADCPTGFVKISWTDVKKICSDDVVKYVLFYKSAIDENYQEVDTMDFNTTSYTYDGLSLISGCYAVKSIDLTGNASQLSSDLCLDNCPEFELPNIFSPNNDKVNDLFKAIKVRQIKEIDLTVFDRWGNLVYRTRDPYFQWDGTSIQSKSAVSEGTFFYICDVFEKRLTGIKKRGLKGYLQVVR